MSAELGEDQKSPCPYADQTSSRNAKVVAPETDNGIIEINGHESSNTSI